MDNAESLADVEETWDGGVVDISLNGGSWFVFTGVGGIFDVWYSDTPGDNPAQAFTGINADLSSDAVAAD